MIARDEEGMKLMMSMRGGSCINPFAWRKAIPSYLLAKIENDVHTSRRGFRRDGLNKKFCHDRLESDPPIYKVKFYDIITTIKA